MIAVCFCVCVLFEKSLVNVLVLEENGLFDYFVEEILCAVGHASVVEEAVDEQDATRVFEFGEREVGRTSGIAALFAEYSEANVRLLNHRDVVGAVADRCRQRPRFALLDQAYHLRFLSRRHATAQHSLALHAHATQLLVEIGLKQIAECDAVYNECICRLWLVLHSSFAVGVNINI